MSKFKDLKRNSAINKGEKEIDTITRLKDDHLNALNVSGKELEIYFIWE